MRWRVIESVDPNFKPAFSDERGHNDDTEGLGLLQVAGPTRQTPGVEPLDEAAQLPHITGQKISLLSIS